MAEGWVGGIFEGRRDIEVWKTMSGSFPEREVSFFQRGLTFASEGSERIGLILLLLSKRLGQVRSHTSVAGFGPSFLLGHS